jgi:hypothetical protein
MAKLNQEAFIDKKAKRLDILDKRYYFSERLNKYFPSLTHVIKNGAPMDPHLLKWFKSNGFNADVLIKEAGDFGSKVHDMIDRNIKGENIVMANPDGTYNYSMEQWESFLKFVDFMETNKVEPIANEIILISEFLNTGQTIDMVCKINGKTWIVDFKTSNYISKDHFIQIAVNAYTWNEFFPELFIEKVGLLHLKAETRGPDKSEKKIQGKGWQIVEPPKHYKEYVPIFKRRYEEWFEENPNYKPAIYSLPTEVKGYKFEGLITGKFDQKPELFLENQ